MLELIKLSSGDAALVVNDALVMAADPAIDDVDYVDVVAENLSGALNEPLTRVEMKEPEVENWTWDGLIEERAVERAMGSVR